MGSELILNCIWSGMVGEREPVKVVVYVKHVTRCDDGFCNKQ